MTTAKPEDIESLIQFFDQSDWDGLRITSGDCRIHLSKDPSQADRYRSGMHVATPALRADAPPLPLPAPAAAGVASTAGSAASADAVRDVAIPEGMTIVRAPNLGTFYMSPKPGAAPYVTVGQRVDPDMEVCLIEVMKLFTSVRAGVSGTVRKILVQDAEMVEFDQPLLVIEPHA